MQTQLNPSEISDLIKSRIEKFKTSAEARKGTSLPGSQAKRSTRWVPGSRSGGD